MVAGALDSSGLISHTPARQLFGGALLVPSAETAAGLMLKIAIVHARRRGATVATAGKLFGGLLGAGTVMLVDPTAGTRQDAGGAGGSLAAWPEARPPPSMPSR